MQKFEHLERLGTAEPRIYVSPDGNDEWSGTRATRDGANGPFATLARARDAVRTLLRDEAGGHEDVVVELAAGTYQMPEPLELSAEDSGRQSAPVVYRGAAGGEARLVGGRVVSGFTKVTEQAALDRLDPSARGHVVCTNLREQGVTDLGGISAPDWAHGQPGLELFFKGTRMTLARWPNEDFAFVTSVDVEGNTELRNRVTLSGRMRGVNEGRFIYSGDRPSRWVDEPDVWLHGHWFWDWADQRQRIAHIDTERRVITMDGPNHRFGYRDGQWYYAVNALVELDTPGEWYLDRADGTLYFWPPEPIEEGDVSVSIAPALVRMKETSNVVLQNLTMESVRGTAVEVSGGSGIVVAGCTIRNTSCGGIDIDGGTGHVVVGCDMYELGEGGIRMTGGDRPTLTPGGHLALNNHVHHCSRWNPLYHPGIAVFGVGHRVAHNLLHDLPHTAIGFTGNDQLIEFNEIHSCVYMANDAGAIYTSPPTEELTMYGHVIRHNYVHHLYGFRNRGCNGAVYLDDLFPGTAITGNVFYHVPRAAFVGGGRDCRIENNVFVDCTPAVHIDARGLGWAAGSEGMLLELLEGIPYKSEVWRRSYPTLENILEDDPMAPKRNVVARNICVRGSWDEIEDKARPGVTLERNLVDERPGFADPSLGSERPEDFALADDSPAFGLGFERIPLDEIGLYRDPFRASWPPVHTVREGGLEIPEEKTW